MSFKTKKGKWKGTPAYLGGNLPKRNKDGNYDGTEAPRSQFSLSDDRIKELYPGVEISRRKETPSEMWQRIKRAHSERRKSRVVTPEFKR